MMVFKWFDDCVVCCVSEGKARLQKQHTKLMLYGRAALEQEDSMKNSAFSARVQDSP